MSRYHELLDQSKEIHRMFNEHRAGIDSTHPMQCIDLLANLVIDQTWLLHQVLLELAKRDSD